MSSDSGFSLNPAHVRIDFFKPESGKWYMTEVLDMSGQWEAPTVYAAVRNALATSRHGRLAEKRWILVVLEPYHQNSFPVTLTPGRATYEEWERPNLGGSLQGEVPEDGKWGMVDWAEMYRVRVSDPDGWRNEGIDVLTPIDQETFLRLVSVSTVVGEGTANMADELRAWSVNRAR